VTVSYLLEAGQLLSRVAYEVQRCVAAGVLDVKDDQAS